MAHVLIIDDEKSIRLTLQAFLTELTDHDVTEAEDGRTGLERLDEQAYDVIVTDLIMPGVSGSELLRRLRDAAPRVPIIVMTGEPSLATAATAIRIGAFDYLSKPVSKDAIVDAVARAAVEKEREDEFQRLQAERLKRQEELEREVDRRTRELRRSEEQFRRAIDGAHTVVYTSSSKAGGQYYSDNVEQVLGYPRRRLEEYPWTWHEAIHADDVKEMDRLLLTLVPGKAYEIEYRFQQADGRWIWLRDRFAARQAAGGETMIDGIAVDITAQKDAEARVRQLREFYLMVLESIREGIWVTDPDDRLVFFNPALEQISGLTADRAIGLSVTQDFPPETNGEFLPYYVQARERLEPVEYQACVRTPGGRSTIQCGWLVPWVRNGQFAGMICSIQDITEQREAQDALERSESRFRALYEAMTEGLALHEIICDENGAAVDYRLTMVNSRFEAITGIQRVDAVGKLASELYGADEPPFLERYARVAATGEPDSFDTYFEPMQKHFHVSVFSPQRGTFATVFLELPG